MGDPHDPARYGELWPEHRIRLGLEELAPLREVAVLSGGWAWHVLSPDGHVELKHAHDHKDIDLFVAPEDVATAVALLADGGFTTVWTRYDRLTSPDDFRRYEKHREAAPGRMARITIDFFVRAVPFRAVKGWRVVEPAYLLGLYRTIHGSGSCFAVRAAARLLAQGIDPLDRPELVAVPAEE